MIKRDHNIIEEGESKFNKSLEDLERISRLEEHANMISCVNTWEGHQVWQKLLSALDREISPYLDEEEEEKLKVVRIFVVPGMEHRKMIGHTPTPAITAQLDRWDRELRRLIAKKGMALQKKDTYGSIILPGG